MTAGERDGTFMENIFVNVVMRVDMVTINVRMMIRLEHFYVAASPGYFYNFNLHCHGMAGTRPPAQLHSHY